MNDMNRRTFLSLAALPLVGAASKLFASSSQERRYESLYGLGDYKSHSFDGKIYATRFDFDKGVSEDLVLPGICFDCYLSIHKRVPGTYLHFPVENNVEVIYDKGREVYSYYNLHSKQYHRLKNPDELFKELRDPGTKWKLQSVYVTTDSDIETDWFQRFLDDWDLVYHRATNVSSR